MLLKRKVKILVDAHVFDGHFQGTRTYLKGLYSCLSKYDEFQIIFASRNIENLKNEFCDCKNIRFIQLPPGGSILRLFYHFPKMINKIKPDYTHFQYVGSIFPYGKMIITMHDILFVDFPWQFPVLYRWIRNVVFKHFAHKADLLITVSNYSRARISDCYRIPIENIHVIPNAVGRQLFLSQNRCNSVAKIKDNWGVEDIILYVGRIEPRKNHQLLVKAFRELGLAAQGKHLVFVGKKDISNPSLLNEMMLLSDQEKMNVHIFENVDDINLQHFYRACQLFVFPSFGEGFGIPVLEAAVNDAPILSSNATAMGYFGFPEQCLFDPSDFNSFCSTLVKALSHPEAYKIDSDILKEYTWESSAKKYRELLLNNLDSI